MSFRGGRNVAMKVPPHRSEATVAFYENTLGLAVRRRGGQTPGQRRTVRCDGVEALPADLQGFWILNPADVVHLVARTDD